MAVQQGGTAANLAQREKTWRTGLAGAARTAFGGETSAERSYLNRLSDAARTYRAEFGQAEHVRALAIAAAERNLAAAEATAGAAARSATNDPRQMETLRRFRRQPVRDRLDPSRLAKIR